MKKDRKKNRKQNLFILSMITLSALFIFGNEAKAYSSDGTIIVRKKHHKSKSLLRRKFVYVHEDAGGGQISSATSSGAGASTSALSSPAKTDTGGISNFSSGLKKKTMPVAKVSSPSSSGKSINSGPAKILHARKVNSGPPKIKRTGSNGSSPGDAVGSGTANMISENIYDEGNWDGFGVDLEVKESFDVNAKLVQ